MRWCLTFQCVLSSSGYNAMQKGKNALQVPLKKYNVYAILEKW